MSDLRKAVIVHIAEEEEEQRFGPNIAFLTSDKASVKVDKDEEPEAPRRGRPPKKRNTDSTVEVDDSQPLPFYQTNSPYLSTYDQTNMMLHGTIAQVDNLNNLVQGEVDTISKSKTLKNKYRYITELAGTSSSLLSTKITAIRELNKVITDSHNLDMKRTKDLKMDDTQDDDKRMMDMYNAFVNAPTGMGGVGVLGPSMSEISTPGMANVYRGDIGGSGDAGYDNYLRNMTPEQNRMRQEKNPYIETVVAYNQETGERWFEVIDTRTGEQVPNMPLPPAMLLDNMRPDKLTGYARNSETDMAFKLKLIGRAIMDEF